MSPPIELPWMSNYGEHEQQENKLSPSSIREAYALKKDGETDPIIITRRQKQIDYGKATQGYKNYLQLVSKENRTIRQPRTPNKYQVCSRRSWDGQIRIWRLLLHAYDDSGDNSEEKKPQSVVENAYQQDSNNNSTFGLVDRDRGKDDGHQTATKSR